MSLVGVLPIKFDYTTFKWEPPKWTTAQEVQMGAEVHRLGKKHFIEQFLAPPDRSLGADPQAMQGPDGKTNFRFRPFDKERPPGIPTKPQPKKSWIGWNKKTAKAGLGLTTLGGMAAGAAVLAPPAAAACAVIGTYAGGMHYGSKRLAIWRYSRWLDRCLKKYQESATPKWVRVTHEVVTCKQCGQRLRVPADKGRIKVTCPGCRAQFEFQGQSTKDIY